MLFFFTDDKPGGVCENEGKPCFNDPYATCIDGCCVCNTGSSVMGGVCTPGNEITLCTSGNEITLYTSGNVIM